jgi:hypothetical protein
MARQRYCWRLARYRNTCASLQTWSSSQLPRPARKSRVLDLRKRLRERDRLCAGGRRIRTVGPSPKDPPKAYMPDTMTRLRRWATAKSRFAAGERRAPGRKHRLSCCLAIRRSLDDRNRFRLSPTYHRLSGSGLTIRRSSARRIKPGLVIRSGRAKPGGERRRECPPIRHRSFPERPRAVIPQARGDRRRGAAEGWLSPADCSWELQIFSACCMVNNVTAGCRYEQCGPTFTRTIPPSCRKTQRAGASIPFTRHPRRFAGSRRAL